MKRLLVFDGERANLRFQNLREGFLVGGALLGQRNDPKPRATIRKEARILDALDSISVPASGDPLPGGIELRNVTAPATLTIDQEDYDLMSTYLDAVPWSTAHARRVSDLLDWFSASDKIDD